MGVRIPGGVLVWIIFLRRFVTKLLLNLLSALSFSSNDSSPQTPGADPTGRMTVISYFAHTVGSPLKNVVYVLLW
jgi:hypothetical protein